MGSVTIVINEPVVQSSLQVIDIFVDLLVRNVTW